MQKFSDQTPSIQCSNNYPIYKSSKNIFKSDNEIQRCLAKLLYGDLFVLRQISILRNTIGIGNLCLFPAVHASEVVPTVHAAAPNEAPKRPPPMKFEDLPIYESPHYEYKDYIEDKQKCPKANVKILHTYLYPKVRKYRNKIGQSLGGMAKELCEIKNEVCCSICKSKQNFINYMRCPDNLALRKGVVALGTLTGIYLGSGTRSTSKKLFGGAVGALAAGALCFPKETDVIFRDVTYNVAKIAIALYNSTCRKNFKMRERIPCQDDLPPPPPPRPYERSNKHCEKK